MAPVPQITRGKARGSLGKTRILDRLCSGRTLEERQFFFARAGLLAKKCIQAKKLKA